MQPSRLPVPRRPTARTVIQYIVGGCFTPLTGGSFEREPPAGGGFPLQSSAVLGFPLVLVLPPPILAVGDPTLVLLDVGSDLAEALAFPSWTGTVLKFAGLCMLLIGVMAWATGVSIHRRAWGRRIAVSGFVLTIVGFAFGTFVEVLEYVLAS